MLFLAEAMPCAPADYAYRFARLRDDGGVDLARDVYVISPFRAVVVGARKICRDLLLTGRVGAIHTTQGKEADVVILPLPSSLSLPATTTPYTSSATRHSVCYYTQNYCPQYEVRPSPLEQ